MKEKESRIIKRREMQDNDVKKKLRKHKNEIENVKDKKTRSTR